MDDILQIVNQVSGRGVPPRAANLVARFGTPEKALLFTINKGLRALMWDMLKGFPHLHPMAIDHAAQVNETVYNELIEDEAIGNALLAQKLKYPQEFIHTVFNHPYMAYAALRLAVEAGDDFIVSHLLRNYDFTREQIASITMMEHENFRSRYDLFDYL